MTIARQRTGRLAEAEVAARLARGGWRIVARNVRLRNGELDLIALDAGTLVFVEVKAAREGAGPCPERPELAVGRDKQRRLRRLAAAWLGKRPAPGVYERIRFDVVGVTFGAGDEVRRYEHIRDAF